MAKIYELATYGRDAYFMSRIYDRKKKFLHAIFLYSQN